MRLIPLALAGLVSGLATAHAADTYKVDHWPGDIETIPCSAWERFPDGTWALKGYIRVGASVIENVGFKGDSSAHMLDRKCGKK